MPSLIETLWRRRSRDLATPVVPPVLMSSGMPAWVFAEFAFRAGLLSVAEQQVYNDFISMTNRAKDRLRQSVHKQILENYL